MIKRILEMEIQGFRSILRAQVIPFDADVVILYGPNGTGKSSLLSALEFGLTGTASDLARFADDYPRCLTNIRSSEPGKVAITFAANSGTKSRSAAVVGEKPGGISNLSEQDKVAYSDHCFLSQSKLQRLIETYLETEDGANEQRLIRFGRELLGLDLLENLTAGLNEVADIRRIRNSSQPYQDLLTAKELTDEEVHRLNRMVDARTETFDSVRRTFLTFLPESEAKDPGIHDSDVLQVSARVEEIERTKSIDRKVTLERFRGLYAHLQNAVALLEASSKGGAEELGGIQDRLDGLKAQERALERELRPVIEAIERSFIPEDRRILNQTPTVSLADRLEQLEVTVKRRVNVAKVELQSISETESGRKELETRLAFITEELARAAERTSASIQEQRQWSDILRIVAARVHANECPVCKRNYSEVNNGSLTDKILGDADQIAQSLRTAEQELSHRAVLQAEQQGLGKRLATLSAQMDAQSTRRQEVDRIIKVYESLLSTVSSLVNARAQWRAVTTDIRRLESQLVEDNARLNQRKQALSEVEEIARSAGLGGLGSPLSIENVGIVNQAVTTIVGELQRAEANSQRLRESASVIRAVAAELQELRRKLEVEKMKQRRLSLGCQQIDLIVQRARVLRLGAIATKSELLSQAFTVTLNRLWREFFDRLAQSERFHPEMSEPALVRNIIKTRVRGVTPNAEAFSNIASVLSSGNLNTAALSLFLALHVMDNSSHSVLVLDDPIQSVDDVHVSQLAILLRALMTQIDRQIIVAVHNRDLFEYLSLELAPTENGRSLITLELQRTGAESDVVVVPRKIAWEPSFRFGT